MLADSVVLDKAHCRQLHTCWQDSGLDGQRWEALSGDVQEAISALYDRKHYDWTGLLRKADCSEWWNQLCDTTLPDKTLPLDMLLVLPTRLDVEINGFNGKLMDGISSSYDWYRNNYGAVRPTARKNLPYRW